MLKAMMPLFILFSFSAFAQEDELYSSRFFKVLPESESHTFSGVTKDVDFSHDSIKVLIWNIKKASLVPWKKEFEKYASDKDLFLIQEAYQNELFNSTIAQYSDIRWDMGISFLYRAYNNTATGNMIGANVEPTYVRVRHTTDIEPVVKTPKATTFAKYPVEGSSKELLVVSIHGINLTAFDTFRRHITQIREEIEKHDGPVLFAGDFNTRTDARTDYLEEQARELGLEPITFENGHCRMRFKLTPYYLDHAYVRGMQIKKASVDCKSQGSDHKPMFLEMAVAE